MKATLLKIFALVLFACSASFAQQVSLVKDINNSLTTNGSNPYNTLALGSSVVFVANDPLTGSELWISNGAALGTTLIKDIYVGGYGSSPSGLTNIGGVIYFSANDGVNGRELWKTDGTIGGTAIVKDINPGTASSGLANFINVGSKIVFKATTASEGAEPWSSDGTATGTNLMHDIEPGTGSSVIEKFTIVGSKLFALATTTTYGREVWVINNFVVLPLEFISFSAQKCNNNQVCLNWKTANEQNVSHFEIERSIEGINFTTTVIKNANNQTENTYTVKDDISALLHSKKIYYRIKQVDNDGRNKLSNINLVLLDNKGLMVYPTLVTNSFFIQNDANAKMQLRLLGADGKLIIQQIINPGTNVVSTEMLPSGIYYYNVASDNGIEISAGKILKQ